MEDMVARLFCVGQGGFLWQCQRGPFFASGSLFSVVIQAGVGVATAAKNTGERIGNMYARQKRKGFKTFSVFIFMLVASAFGINSVGRLTDLQLDLLSIAVFLLIVGAGVLSLRSS